tara:strand:+ start:228 stop:380 length:153 start_codon:yes stop_codon:yes gene_type:complete
MRGLELEINDFGVSFTRRLAYLRGKRDRKSELRRRGVDKLSSPQLVMQLT